MRARLLGLLGASVIFGFACAQGTSAISSGPNGGDGGSGGAPTMMTTGPGGPGPGSGTGGGSNNCSEDPCKLVVPQCGCDTGQQCTLAGNDRVCAPAGTTAPGDACSDDTCAPGSACVQTAPPVSTCAKFCATDADCEAPGGLCLLTLDDGTGNDIPGVTLCTENCDMATNAGCVNGAACQLLQEPDGQMRLLTACVSAGGGQSSSPCVGATDCAATYGCIGVDANDNPICLKWCRVGAADCPSGYTCTAFSPALTLGATEYGGCL